MLSARIFLLLALVAVAVTKVQGRHHGHSPEARQCHQDLRPADADVDMNSIIDTCIPSIDGLQAVIDGLNVRSPRRGHGHGGHGGIERFPFTALEAANSDMALLLRQCIATAMGQTTTAADGTVTFNVDEYIAALRAQVANTASQANVESALTGGCDTALLTAFKVKEFKKCVKVFCATGAAP